MHPLDAPVSREDHVQVDVKRLPEVHHLRVMWREPPLFAVRVEGAAVVALEECEVTSGSGHCVVVKGAETYAFECADDVVRSVHLSGDTSRLAVGSEKQGKGWISLYDANEKLLLGEWEHPKSVWCVRLSPDGLP